jgi:hypothetical protein
MWRDSSDRMELPGGLRHGTARAVSPDVLDGLLPFNPVSEATGSFLGCAAARGTTNPNGPVCCVPPLQQADLPCVLLTPRLLHGLRPTLRSRELL